ncbi:MAG: acyl-CoA dehydratase activase-related protein [Oscillospiraceae bacterium]|nr:acyl-CoA dehydratase activase-related protein [Oscillospiraceae bacterium]
MEKETESAEYEGVRVVGIPRALNYYRFGDLWTGFFSNLGLENVLSEPTSRKTVETGERLSNDESCYSAKIYMGHVQELIGKCDAVFIPRTAGYGERIKFCTRFESLYDLVRNTFRDSGARFMTLSLDWRNGMSEEEDFIDLGTKLGFEAQKAADAYKAALEDRKQKEEALRDRQLDLLKKPGNRILLAAHDYIAHDPYVGGQLVKMLEDLGCTVLYADRVDRKEAVKRSFELSDTLPWQESREILGAVDLLKDNIDGAVLASSYPCSPDSMTDEFITRTVKDLPILTLTLDVQDGTAGLETRLESFVDIIRFRRGQDHAEAKK